MVLQNQIKKGLSHFYYSKYELLPHVFKDFNTFKKNEKMSLDELSNYQLVNLKKLLLHAQKNTKYYKRIFKEAGFNPNNISSVDDLKCLPILTKEIIKNSFSDLTAENLQNSEYHMSYTGGTRGIKMQFLRDYSCRSKRVALQWRSDTWTNWDVLDRVAYIWPAFQDVDLRYNWKQFLKEHYFQKVKICFAGVLNETIAQNIYESLLQFKPTLIRCFPTPAAYMADYLAANNLTIPSLKAIVSTGEPLTNNKREIISQGFKTDVYNLYACRETGTIAAECSTHKNLHMAIDSVVMQIHREKKSYININEGKIIITDIHNYAMPLIRYEIGDYGILLENRCSCGLEFPLMKNVVGRVADGFWDTKQNFISPMALGDILDDCPNKKVKVQLIQRDYNKILIRISQKTNPDRSTVEYFHTRLEEVFDEGTKINHEIVKDIQPEASGKFRYSICEITEKIS